MAGRPLIQEGSPLAAYYTSNESVIRRRILRETIERFAQSPNGDRYQSLALANLVRWKRESRMASNTCSIHVLPGDWGVVTHGLTQHFGECFAVLNMANAYVPGGAFAIFHVGYGPDNFTPFKAEFS